MDTAEDWADDRGFDRGTVDCSEVDLHYVAAGSRESPMCLLLHGFPECWYTWRHQLEPLADDYFVVAPDLRGYNRSDRPREVAAYDLPRLLNDVYELVQAFDHGSAHVVGHDWGGALGLSFARHHPAHVDRLVVANAIDPERLGAQLRGWQLLRSWYAFYFQLPRLPETMLTARGCRLLERLYDDTAVPDAYTDDDLARLHVTWERDGALRAAVDHYRALGRRTVRRALAFDYPPRIYVPTRLVWGGADDLVPTSVAGAIADGIDDPETVTFDDATHWLHAEYPERFTETVVEFLRSA